MAAGQAGPLEGVDDRPATQEDLAYPWGRSGAGESLMEEPAIGAPNPYNVRRTLLA